MSNYILGPVMVPNQKIYRDPNSHVNEPHYVCFQAETIIKIRERFHKNNFEKNININHGKEIVDDVIMTKSFIINDSNKKNLPSKFQNLPIGTWMVEYDVKNEKVWDMIRLELINGFSAQGNFKYSKL